MSVQRRLYREPDSYFKHAEGIGLIGRGETIEVCFVNAAFGMFSLMVDTTRIHFLQILTFEFEEADPEQALIRWLNLLLAKAKKHRLIFGDFRLKRNGNQWTATVAGEPYREAVQRGVEVKHANSAPLSISKVDHLWEARCVIKV